MDSELDSLIGRMFFYILYLAKHTEGSYIIALRILSMTKSTLGLRLVRRFIRNFYSVRLINIRFVWKPISTSFWILIILSSPSRCFKSFASLNTRLRDCLLLFTLFSHNNKEKRPIYTLLFVVVRYIFTKGSNIAKQDVNEIYHQFQSHPPSFVWCCGNN
jgi:hypothetical protein